MSALTKISNWGNYPRIEADVRPWPLQTESPQIARGMGRCYGDSALSTHIVDTRSLNHFLDFDAESGLLTVEAGLTFDEILQVCVPRGWFLPVTPGTRFVTAGGALASDVHGKNHHAEGSFSDHVRWFDLLTASGEICRCSRTENTELFYLTLGGMGLTGIIKALAFYLKPIETAYIRQHTLRCENLDETMAGLEAYGYWTNSVAWLDCMAGGRAFGRSILMLGEAAKQSELTQAQSLNPLKVHSTKGIPFPIDMPSFTLNRFTVQAFNQVYFHKHPKGSRDSVVHYEPFYYPLDKVLGWNRIYGKRGFTQYQLVIPHADARKGLQEVLELLAKRKMSSFLTVLKIFGEQSENYLRFPKAGFTLTLDFGISASLWPFLNELDGVVERYGGRLYLTKDVRMNPDFFRRTYPMAQEFIEKIKALDPTGKFQSLQSQRLGIHA